MSARNAGSSVERLALTQRRLATALGLFGFAFVLLLAVHRPPAAFGCSTDPCNSDVVQVLCPNANGSGTGTAMFNIPKGAKATGANGLSESNFTAADKNRVQFTVK